MAHIKEPKGVDFIINSRNLTKEEELAISNYILAYKAKSYNNKTKKPKRVIANNLKKKINA